MCIQKFRLIAQHKAAIDAALPLASQIHAMFDADYAKLYAAIERGRELVNQARREIDAHIAEHGC